MKQYNCKNCGAPIEHSYNHRCPYCNTLFDFNEPEKNVIEVKPEDLVNVELRSIERTPERDSIILVFSGYKCTMPKVYEYDGKGTYISRMEQYINPPKCGFCIELPLYEIEQHGFGYVMSAISNTGVRFNEIDRIAAQVKDKIVRFVRWY